MVNHYAIRSNAIDIWMFWWCNAPYPAATLTRNMPTRKRRCFLNFSYVCLSRACLGKMMHFHIKWRKKYRFLTCPVDEVRRTAKLVEAFMPHKEPKKNVLCFELFLCLSRACLGKTIIFVWKWLKKMRFSHGLRTATSPRRVFLSVFVCLPQACLDKWWSLLLSTCPYNGSISCSTCP
eukprot:COSAG06_NODE_7653_length_2427_cov_4.548110_1_plen_178_part_00